MKLLPTLLPEAAEDLLRIVGQHIAAPSAALLREARLGLLVEMVTLGWLPSAEDYMERRAIRAAEGEEWPVASLLIDAYGGWRKALDAAVRLAFTGTAARVPSSYKHAGQNRPSTTRQDVVDGIELCRRSLSYWPDEPEYVEWSKLARRTARKAGKEIPFLPGPKQYRRLFGTYDRALQVAKREGWL